jgi:hypothetical protein
MRRKARKHDDGPIRYRDENWERRRHAPKHAAKPQAFARSVGTLVTVAALILVGFVAVRQYNTQITLTALRQAAREGARLDSVGEPASGVVAEALRAAAGLGPVEISVTSCPPGTAPAADAVVDVSYASLSAQAVMLCET